MIHDISFKITQRLIRNGIAKADREEEYIYGLEIAIEKAVSYLTLLILAWYLNLLVPSLFFYAFFFALRKRSGGFHANTYIQCYAGTILIYLFCSKFMASLFLKGTSYMYLTLVVMSVFIVTLAPINHPNLNMDAEEMDRCKRKTRQLLFFELLAITVASYLKINAVHVVFASMGIMTCSILLIIAKLTKQEVRRNDEGFG